MADTKVFHLRDGVTIEGIGREVETFLRDEKELTVEGIAAPDGYLVQAKESSNWKNFTGLGKALQVQIMPSGDSDVLVNIGIGKWADKVGAAGVGAILFAPLLITAGVGAYMQNKLPGEVFECIEKFIMSGGRSVRRNLSIERTDGTTTKCPSCGVSNPKGTKFCSGCGSKLAASCPACGKDVELGKKFCPYCGSSMVEKKTLSCPKCGVEVEEGRKFCSECGASMEILSKKKCPSCGELVDKDQKFCPSCGSAMSGKKICSKCGTELEPTQKFCGNCGNKME
ncbi:MAG: zinc ribbon domain-containing protein [Selenomonas ruminantium]|jgi:RNA polymerase subunit RPABC4/transcription elongation factor Spt4|uniref:Zinc ribbon domain-containing protein n=1 Tax=Selenomonas ruminantium TaxID=971 RepID=A0A927WLH5_SELRU|nr:zinc ribbon domain-containing protein [Selenomonas ruminantium]MBE6085387.1 zinc ribbon domain-containing protein [Selenomonas ruminantium]